MHSTLDKRLPGQVIQWPSLLSDIIHEKIEVKSQLAVTRINIPMWLLDTLLQIDSVRTQRTVNFGVDSAARFGLKCNPFRVNASFRARALRLTHFVKRSKAGNWLLSSASALALAATISPTVGVAQTQVGSWCPNP